MRSTLKSVINYDIVDEALNEAEHLIKMLKWRLRNQGCEWADDAVDTLFLKYLVVTTVYGRPLVTLKLHESNAREWLSPEKIAEIKWNMEPRQHNRSKLQIPFGSIFDAVVSAFGDLPDFQERYDYYERLLLDGNDILLKKV